MPLLKYINFYVQVCGDLKIYYKLGGTQGATSSYPCYACEAYRDPKTGVWTSCSPCKLRTYASNKQHSDDWMEAGGGAMGGQAGMLIAKEYYNCVNCPLVGEDKPHTPLYLILLPPPLHLLLGVVNDSLKLLLGLWPGLVNWLHCVDVLFSPYHGLVLEGNRYICFYDGITFCRLSFCCNLTRFCICATNF